MVSEIRSFFLMVFGLYKIFSWEFDLFFVILKAKLRPKVRVRVISNPTQNRCRDKRITLVQ